MEKITSVGVIGRLYRAIETLTGSSWVDKIAMTVPSTQETESYGWLGATPALREWLGGRKAQALREFSLTLKNKPFEATIDILRKWLRRDQTMQLNMRIAQLAARYDELWAKELSTLITNGTGSTSMLAYDNQYFFDSDHSEGASGTQLNLLTASQVTKLDVTTATAPTSAEMALAILGVIGYMLNIKDDQGEPANTGAKSFLVMCGSPAIWSAAQAAAINAIVNTGSGTIDNQLKNQTDFKVEVVMNPRLSAMTTQFVVFRTDAASKPLIKQIEYGPLFTKKAEGSDYEHDNDAHQYGVQCSGAVGYGLWQMAAHATLS
jgi:phage major head subunit gpT-like protein